MQCNITQVERIVCFNRLDKCDLCYVSHNSRDSLLNQVVHSPLLRSSAESFVVLPTEGMCCMSSVGEISLCMAFECDYSGRIVQFDSDISTI